MSQMIQVIYPDLCVVISISTPEVSGEVFEQTTSRALRDKFFFKIYTWVLRLLLNNRMEKTKSQQRHALSDYAWFQIYELLPT